MSWTRHHRLLLKGGAVTDSSGSREADILVRDGVIEEVGKDLVAPDAHVEDVSGLVVTPGFLDIHVHLRDPGGPESETLASWFRASYA